MSVVFQLLSSPKCYSKHAVLFFCFSLLVLSGCSEDTVIKFYEEDEVLVYISTGEIQCQFEGHSIEVSKGYLIGGGIQVNEEYCGYTSQQYITVCGAGTSDIHVFEIDKQHLNKAENLGFSAVNNLEGGWQQAECPE